MQQFLSLLKKCFLVKISKPLEILVTFILPIFVASISLYPPLFKNEYTVKTSDYIFDTVDISNTPLPTDNLVKLVIRYFPSDAFTNKIMENVKKMVNDVNFDVIAYRNEHELNEAIKPEQKFIETKLMLFQLNFNFFNKFYNFFRSFIKMVFNKEAVNETLAIVEFHGTNRDKIVTDFKFTLTLTSFTSTSNLFGYRYNASIPYETKSYEKYSEKLRMNVNSGDTNTYLGSKFAYVMHLINNAYLTVLSNKTQVIKISALRFPYKKQLEYDFGKGSCTKLIGFLISIGFSAFCVCIVKEIVEEKASGLRLMMNLMGMDSFGYYTSYFTCNLIVACVQAFILSLIYTSKIGSWAIVEHAESSLIFFILVLYLITIELYSMAITTAFEKDPNSAIFAVVMLQMIFDTMVNLVFKRPSAMGFNFGIFELPESWHLISALVPHSAIKLMFEVVEFNQQYANYCPTCGYGTFWTNFFTPPPAFRLLTIGSLATALIISSILFLLIIVFSNGSKINRRLSRDSLLNESCLDGVSVYIECNEQENHKRQTFYEKLPSNFEIGITIENVWKYFRNKAVVKNISLKFCKGEITGLLGHNGAGKSTLINMITGRLKLSKGNIRIFDSDVVLNPEKAFLCIGYCPQFDILYENLTVKQNLTLFCAIKGLKGKEIEKEVRKILSLLNIHSKKDEKVKFISGGLKRRLSLGIALCGNIQVLILDEPTSGMDPEAKRDFQNILQSVKRHYIILFVTHSSEEADSMCDRIAVLSNGRLLCYGTPMYLKQLFNVGYCLRIFKMEHINMQHLQSALQLYFNRYKIINETRREITVHVDRSETRNISEFLCFTNEKKCLQSLGILSISVSVNGMNEVLLSASKSNFNVKSETQITTTIEKLTVSKQKYGIKTFIRKTNALFRKRCQLILVNWMRPVMLLIFFVTCITCFLFGIKLVYFHADIYPNWQRELSLNHFDDPIKREAMIIFNSDKKHFSFYNNYFDVLRRNGFEIKGFSQRENDFEKVISTLLPISKESSCSKRSFPLLGASMVNGEHIAWYHGDSPHTLPISMNFIYESLQREILNGTPGSIVTRNKQFIFKSLKSPIGAGQAGLRLYPLSFSTPLAMLLFYFTILPFRERASKAKLIQIMSGASTVQYWLSNFLFDIISYSAIVAATVAIFIAFDRFYGFSLFMVHFDTFLAFTLLFFGFGMAAIFTAYVESFANSSNDVSWIIINAYFGLFVPGIEALFYRLTSQAPILHSINKGIKVVSIVTCLASGLRELLMFESTRATYHTMTLVQPICNYKRLTHFLPLEDFCSKYCATCYGRSVFVWGPNGILDELFILLMHTLIFLSLLVIIELRFCAFFYTKDANREMIIDEIETERLIENDFLVNFTAKKALIAHKITKNYSSCRALKAVSFTANSNEIFGILGINGSGKSVCLKVLTGEERPSFGTASINDHFLTSDLSQYQKLIGYCPQYEGYIEYLTGRQMLRLIAELRDIYNYKSDAERILELLNLKKIGDDLILHYSGGNKRKLSVAMALIGIPPVIFLDEPTAGVDFQGSYELWKVFSLLHSQKGCAIVLTSHSIKECDVLCTTISVMEKGKMHYLGYTQRLKAKCSQGFTLTVKQKKYCDCDYDLDAKVFDTFPSAVLRDRHDTTARYYIPQNIDLTLSELFKKCEKIARDNDFEDFEIYDTTLEDIFLSYNKRKRASFKFKDV